MKVDRGLLGVLAAIVGAAVCFAVVGGAIYYKVADVRVNGLLHGGPTMLAGAMAGLFGGGLAALVTLILLLRWLNGRNQS